MKISLALFGAAILLPVAFVAAQEEQGDVTTDYWTGWDHECTFQGEGCEESEWCDTGSRPRKCWPKRAVGKGCNRDIKCLSDCCNKANWKCAPNAVCHDPCYDVSCPDGKVCNPEDGLCHPDVECDEDIDCEYGFMCSPAGECVPIDKCTGITCPDGKVCDPVDGTCKREAECDEDTDCEYGFMCDLDAGECVPIDKCAAVICDPGFECEHGVCVAVPVDKCEGVSCPPGQECDDADGLCYVKDDCANDLECEYGFMCLGKECVPIDKSCEGVSCPDPQVCKDGLCVLPTDPCANVLCPEEKFCNDNGVCIPKRIIGETCAAGLQCKTGCCSHLNKCEECPDPCDTIRCHSGYYCHLGTCYSPNKCYGVECPGKFCVNGLCQNQNPCAGVICNGAHWCHQSDGNCYPAFCSVDNDCPLGYSCNSQQSCVTNVACHVDDNCDQPNHKCEDGICVFRCNTNAHCSNNQFCNAKTHECNAKLGNGQVCGDNEECSSGFCNSATQPARCHQGFANGRWCDFDYECLSKICHAKTNACIDPLRVGFGCSRDQECQSNLCSCSGQICQPRKKRDGIPCDLSCQCESDFCHQNVCKQRFALGESCEENSDCASGSCDTGCVSAWRRACGSKTCVPVDGEVGDYCTDGSQCKSGICNTSQKQCGGHGGNW